MSKQINYWLEFNGFLLLAQKALDMGCTIVREDVATRALSESRDLGIITEDDRAFWYFYLPGAGAVSYTHLTLPTIGG